MIGRSVSKIIRDQSTGMVFFGDAGSDRPPNATTSNTRKANITLQQTKATSTVSRVACTDSSIILKALGTTEISNKIEHIIYDSRRTKKKTRYEGAFKKLRKHCIQWNENPYIADVKPVLIFLNGMHKSRCLYSGICVAQSALSSVVMIKKYDKLSSYPLVTRFV